MKEKKNKCHLISMIALLGLSVILLSACSKQRNTLNIRDENAISTDDSLNSGEVNSLAIDDNMNSGEVNPLAVDDNMNPGEVNPLAVDDNLKKEEEKIRLTNVNISIDGVYTCDYHGTEREFMLYIPQIYMEEANKSATMVTSPEEVPVKEGAPLLFMLHGYGDSMEQFAADTCMNETAEQYGYAVVYPQGIGDPSDKTSGAGWNSGLKDSGNDDTGYLVALAEYLQDIYHFDANRTFAAGFSNGAFMMYRLACQAPETFRAVASVAGFMTTGAWAEKPKEASIGILQINGTNDDVVPYYDEKGHKHGGEAPAITEVIEYWKNANGLDVEKDSILSDKATMYRYSSVDTDNSVVFISIQDGYHSWPKEQYSGIRVNEVILDYFNEYK